MPWVLNLIGMSPHSTQELTESVVRDNEYMLCRYDNSVIDGKNWEHGGEETLLKNLHHTYASGI